MNNVMCRGFSPSRIVFDYFKPVVGRITHCTDAARRWATTRAASTTATSNAVPTIANLSSTRSLLAVYGRDAQPFLQGLSSNTVPKELTLDTPCYNAFLSPQGRMLFDTFVYPVHHNKSIRDALGVCEGDTAYLIECDIKQLDSLSQNLRRYKLRAKCKIHPYDQNGQVYAFRGMRPPSEDAVACMDRRAPGMGYRLIAGHNHGIDARNESQKDYTVRRMMQGVAEGQNEIFYDNATPLEANMDIMHAIDFKKGCYVGQELTARTHHTGVVRKRIVPVQLYALPQGQEEVGDIPIPSDLVFTDEKLPLPPSQSALVKMGSKGRSPGKFCAGIGNIGLASLRLDTLTSPAHVGAQWTDEQGVLQSVGIKGFIPNWWPDGMKHTG